jgi:hypothetical protein
MLAASPSPSASASEPASASELESSFPLDPELDEPLAPLVPTLEVEPPDPLELLGDPDDASGVAPPASSRLQAKPATTSVKATTTRTDRIHLSISPKAEHSGYRADSGDPWGSSPPPRFGEPAGMTTLV